MLPSLLPPNLLPEHLILGVSCHQTCVNAKYNERKHQCCDYNGHSNAKGHCWTERIGARLALRLILARCSNIVLVPIRASVWMGELELTE